MNEIVTLASLVEKETGRPQERPIVASVYENRLRRGMALDCDPTTIYAALLDDRYRGTIYRSDLKSDNAYNTYRHAGLPPGPDRESGPRVAQSRARACRNRLSLFCRQGRMAPAAISFPKPSQQHNVAVQQYRRATQALMPSRMLPFRLVYHPRYDLNLGDHVFPARKYRLIRASLLEERFAEPADFVEPRSRFR